MATFSDAYILCFGQLKNSGGFNAKDFPEVSNVKAPEEAWYSFGVLSLLPETENLIFEANKLLSKKMNIPISGMRPLRALHERASIWKEQNWDALRANQEKGGTEMDVSAAILKRASIRKWKPVSVEKEKIEKVLEAGRRAPSWGNSQPWRFIVVQDKAKKEELAKAAGGQPVVSNAPVVIVCCGSIEDFSRKMQRAALKQLMEAGALDWTDDILDKIVLESDLFAPYRLGEQVMTMKAGEQIMIAIAFMTLEAVNQGLGTCWVGAMSPKDAHKVMNLPNNVFVHDLIPLGYPDEDPKPRPRKDLKKIAFWEKYIV